MKKKVKILLILSIILLILIVAILLTVGKQINKEGIEYSKPRIQSVEKKEKDIVKNRTSFYTVSTYINRYINYCYSPSEEVLDIIDEDYKENNDINKDNYKNKIKLTGNMKKFVPEEMYCEVNNNISTYYAYGKLAEFHIVNYNEVIDKAEEFEIIVIIDYNNKTYSVIPADDKEIENIPAATNPIEENSNNKVSYVVYTDEQMVRNYVSTFRTKTNYDIEYLYNHLEEDYRNKRFTSIEQFKKYIEERQKLLIDNPLEKWNIIPREGYDQYICVDNMGNYYIFNETAPMQFTMMLDIYTIELPEYIEKYDSCNPKEKVVLNIEKIKQALNSGDYTYVYSKLAQSFKNNKYKTEEEFKNYIKSNLYDFIKIEYKNFKNEGETYIYSLAIKNMMNDKDKEISMEIIMQLKEERDFIMSFSIK